MTDSFAASTEITARYINLKYAAATKSDWRSLMLDAGSVIKTIKSEKEAVYTDGPKVHGARQASQLDILDEREFRISAVYDNAMNMMVRAI
jgi:hypothetical protein